MYKISEFSEISELSKETLRYYEKVKLLEPEFIDTTNIGANLVITYMSREGRRVIRTLRPSCFPLI
jgi:hypothetical protein